MGFKVHSFYLWFKCILVNFMSATFKVNISPCLVKQQVTNTYAGLEIQLHSVLSRALDIREKSARLLTEPPVSRLIRRAALSAMDERKSLQGVRRQAASTAAVPLAAAFNTVYPLVSVSGVHKEHVTHETGFVGGLLS